jgi:hypothetical protein
MQRSTCSGQVLVLAETYANCVEQTSSHLFYAIAASEKILIFGAEVFNAFAEALQPKQPFYIKPNKAFCEWWVLKLKQDPMPPGHIIPVLSAMQGHPESPWLWEKHADKILCKIGLTPTIHEPCLYLGEFNGKPALFLRQVDNFAITTPDGYTANLVMDLINNRLMMPIKQQGYLDIYNDNGVVVIQTRDYIKITISTFVKKVFGHHIATWMKTSYPTPNQSTPLLANASWLKEFNSAIGNSGMVAQSSLAKQMQLAYQSGVGELIWAMTTRCPNFTYMSIKLSQSNTCPDKIHYHSLKHALKYSYNSHNDGIYFWRTTSYLELPVGPPPQICSNKTDIILDDHPQFDPLIAHTYANSDWATCPKT